MMEAGRKCSWPTPCISLKNYAAMANFVCSEWAQRVKPSESLIQKVE